ncbi:Ankyrin repeat-containing domain,Ankyrin repeat [Cinara cedri]|uniref:Ankyrin repeat-containing domain,Ankyrin repeat n=1 Tax=Cinara cedri TaxID=506608 RepID=A0A5E4N3A7_9HEMI|nr:Ankyrin repeat-containing domain,Ankyrin repeat [Cinara cedri]
MIDREQANEAIEVIRDPSQPQRRKNGEANELSTMLLKTRIKNEIERGKLLEAKAKAEIGELVPIEEVKTEAFNAARVVRNNLLNIPDRVSALLASMSDAEKIHELLSQEITTALEDQSNIDINKRGINGKTPLHCAIELDELSLVDLLLSKRSINPLITDNENKSALDYAKDNRVLQVLINHKYGLEKDSLLHLAAILNEENAVRFLINKGINVNEQNALLHTPLHLAAGAGHEKIIEILVKEGSANKDVLDIRNHTPLHYAVNNKRLGAVKLLSDLGASSNTVGHGKGSMKLSPVHVAVSSSNYDERDLCLDIVRCLINAPNSQINLQDYEKKTPLHYAERVKNVEALLARKDIEWPP